MMDFVEILKLYISNIFLMAQILTLTGVKRMRKNK